LLKEGYEIKNSVEAQSIIDIMEDLDYDIDEITKKLNDKIQNSNLINDKEKKYIVEELNIFLNDNGYLKTIN